MLKYILSLTLAITMLACGADDQTAQQEAQSSSEQQSQPQFQPGQSASDIDVSDEELNTFTEVSMVAQEVQMNSQQEMVAIIEEEGLDIQTYNTIAEARFNNQDESALDVSAEDIEKFDATSEDIENIQSDVEAEITEAVEAEGMEMERFMQINMAMQESQELQQRVQQKMMENMQNQSQGQPQQQ